MGIAILYFTGTSPAASAEAYTKFVLDIITGNTTSLSTLSSRYPSVSVNTGSSIIVGSNSTVGNWGVTPGQWVNTGYSSANTVQRSLVQIEAPCVNTSYKKYGVLRLVNFYGNGTTRNNNYTDIATLIQDGVVTGQQFNTSNDLGTGNTLGFNTSYGFSVSLTGLVSNVAIITNRYLSNNVPDAFAGANGYTNTTIANATTGLSFTPTANNESFRPVMKIGPVSVTATEGTGNAFSNSAAMIGTVNTLRAYPTSVSHPLIISWSQRHLFMFISAAGKVSNTDGTCTQLGLFEYPEVAGNALGNVAPFVAVTIPSISTFAGLSALSANQKNIFYPWPAPCTTNATIMTISSGSGIINSNPAVVNLMGGYTWDGYRWPVPIPLYNPQSSFAGPLPIRIPSPAVQPNGNTTSYMTYGVGFTNFNTNTDNGAGISNYTLFLDQDNNNKYVALPIFFTAPKFNINYASLSQLSQVWFAPSGPNNAILNTTVTIGSNTYLYCRGCSGPTSNVSFDDSPYYFIPYF